MSEEARQAKLIKDRDRRRESQFPSIEVLTNIPALPEKESKGDMISEASES
jgi:hypothetical protein